MLSLCFAYHHLGSDVAAGESESQFSIGVDSMLLGNHHPKLAI
jgi:hypothetical protein